MKEKVLDMINNLHQFADELEAVARHPYGTGVDVAKAMGDLKSFLDNFKNEIEAGDKEPVETETKE